MVTSPSGSTTTKRPVAHGSRKIVTVLFVDMVDSTVLADDLDAESFRALMEHYYEAAHNAVARHGGHVEKFIGDAVMAVFGSRSSTRTTPYAPDGRRGASRPDRRAERGVPAGLRQDRGDP